MIRGQNVMRWQNDWLFTAYYKQIINVSNGIKTVSAVEFLMLNLINFIK